MIKGYCVEIHIIANSEHLAKLKKIIFRLTLKVKDGQFGLTILGYLWLPAMVLRAMDSKSDIHGL
jgi:hypothetical protein